MAMTPTQVQQDESDFGSAFGEDQAAAPSQSDDDAFGLNIDPEGLAHSEEDGIPNSPEEAQEAPDEQAQEDATGAEATQGEAPQQPAGLTIEEQRQKSWEGRQRAEAQRKAAMQDDGDDEDETQEEESAESPEQEAAEEVAKAVKNGMDPEQALKQIASDFGTEFTDMITAVIDARVAQATGQVTNSVDEIINDIVDNKARMHFETIAEKHPDFMEVANSAAFQKFCAANPDCAQIVESGSAREINKMLDSYKAQSAPPEPQDNSGADAAEGVRSSGVRLPKQPPASSDYAAAWDEFSD